jgi:hypothetical protein
MVEDTLYGLMLASLMSSIAIGVAAYVLADAPSGPVWSATIFASTGINGISNWVAAAALFTAVLIPTVFAPLTGTLFQTASQAAMVGVGVAASMAGAAAGPVAGAAGSGLAGAGAGGAIGGMTKGMAGGLGGGTQTIGQQAAGKMQSMGLGERLLYAAPHSLKNVAVAGTTGVLSAMGASSAARSIATVAPLSSSVGVSQGISRINASRQELAQGQETSTALEEANTALGGFVFNAVTAPPQSLGLASMSPQYTTQWYSQQTLASPSQILSQARRSHVITPQQYQAIFRNPSAQAEFAEGYKQQLHTINERDVAGNLTTESLARLGALRRGFEGGGSQNLRRFRQGRNA